MDITLLNIIRLTVGLALGGAIGSAFGFIQKAAARRNQIKHDAGKLKTGWAVMPGSLTRVAFLLVALALIQLVCPMLFTDSTQWWVSGGIVIGYGWLLFKDLRRAIA